jgi:hypothetical protein
VLTAKSPLRGAEIAYADLLLKSGDAARGKAVLETILARMHHEIDELHRPAYWYLHWHPVALALAGQKEAALTMLERYYSVGAASGDSDWLLDAEPALDDMRSDPRFVALRKKAAVDAQQQRERLARARAEGLVPDRTGH